MVGLFFFWWGCVRRWCRILKGTTRPYCPILPVPCLWMFQLSPGPSVPASAMLEVCLSEALSLVPSPLAPAPGLWLDPGPGTSPWIPLAWHYSCYWLCWLHLRAVELCPICEGTASASPCCAPSRGRKVLLKLIQPGAKQPPKN